MKTGRRGFLAALMAGAAALGLPVTVAKAEPEVLPILMPGQRWILDEMGDAVADRPISEWLEPYKPATWMDARLQEATLSDPPLTFEAMRQACAARGCTLHYAYFPWSEMTRVDHTAADGTITSGPLWEWNVSDPISEIDAWRRSLHEGGDV